MNAIPSTQEASAVDESPLRPRVALVLALGLLNVVLFETALTAGAPLGAAALGGTNPGRLPNDLRFVTALTACLWLFAALLVLARGGTPLVRMPTRLVLVVTRVILGLLGLGALMNFASRNPWERFGWGPFTLVLFVLCLVLARCGEPCLTSGTRPRTDTPTQRRPDSVDPGRRPPRPNAAAKEKP